jgi:hypothetical protein
MEHCSVDTATTFTFAGIPHISASWFRSNGFSAASLRMDSAVGSRP